MSNGSHPLHGDWVGEYGGHGEETIRIDHHPELPKAICATKITGDSNVPAGQITWWANVGESGIGRSYQGLGQIAGPGYTNPKFVEANVFWANEYQINVTWAGTTVQYTRKSYPNGVLLNLLGDWKGYYDGHGYETIRIHHHQETAKAIAATKLTGDVNVPASHITWWFKDPCDGNAKAVFHGFGKIAGRGYTNPQFIDATLVYHDRNTIDVTWTSLNSTIRFSRISG